MALIHMSQGTLPRTTNSILWIRTGVRRFLPRAVNGPRLRPIKPADFGRPAKIPIERRHLMLVPDMNAAATDIARQISTSVFGTAAPCRAGGSARWLGCQAGALKSYEMRPAGR
jgi:hypothetical protein